MEHTILTTILTGIFSMSFLINMIIGVPSFLLIFYIFDRLEKKKKEDKTDHQKLYESALQNKIEKLESKKMLKSFEKEHLSKLKQYL